MYDKLVGKVKNTDTSGFGLKNKYDTDRLAIEKKHLILVDVTNLVKKKRLRCKLFKTKITKISFTHGTIVNV